MNGLYMIFAIRRPLESKKKDGKDTKRWEEGQCTVYC